jgi:hypothetical protein
MCRSELITLMFRVIGVPLLVRCNLSLNVIGEIIATKKIKDEPPDRDSKRKRQLEVDQEHVGIRSVGWITLGEKRNEIPQVMNFMNSMLVGGPRAPKHGSRKCFISTKIMRLFGIK